MRNESASSVPPGSCLGAEPLNKREVPFRLGVPRRPPDVDAECPGQPGSRSDRSARFGEPAFDRWVIGHQVQPRSSDKVVQVNQQRKADLLGRRSTSTWTPSGTAEATGRLWARILPPGSLEPEWAYCQTRTSDATVTMAQRAKRYQVMGQRCFRLPPGAIGAL